MLLHLTLIYTSIEFFWSTIQAGRAIPKLVARKGDIRNIDQNGKNQELCRVANSASWTKLEYHKMIISYIYIVKNYYSISITTFETL